MTRSRKLPLGQDLKDLPWRIGAWFTGIWAFIILLWIFTGGSVSLFQWWQKALLFLIGVVLSYPYVRDTYWNGPSGGLPAQPWLAERKRRDPSQRLAASGS